MRLKIICDGYYPFFPRFCKFLYFSGYDISVDFTSGVKYRDSGGFFDFLETKGCEKDFVQLSYCHPGRSSTNFFAKSSIAMVDSAVLDDEGYDKLKEVNDIILLESVLSKSEGLGQKKHLIRYFFDENIEKTMPHGDFVLFCSHSGGNIREIIELIVAYCRISKKIGSVSLILNFNYNFNENIEKIRKSMIINGFFMDDFPNLHITNSSHPEELLKFADFGIFLRDSGIFNVLSLDCMARGIPVIVPDSPEYGNICRKNICSVFDEKISSEEIERQIEFVISDSGSALEKAGKAKISVFGRNSKSLFQSSIDEVMTRHGVFPGCNIFFSEEKSREVII